MNKYAVLAYLKKCKTGRSINEIKDHFKKFYMISDSSCVGILRTLVKADCVEKVKSGEKIIYKYKKPL